MTEPASALERLLGRSPILYPIGDLSGAHILVTGHRGGVGQALVPVLRAAGADVLGVDLPEYDITSRSLTNRIKRLKPDVIYHLAADKHAPAGEVHPYVTQRVNIEGTERMLMALGPYKESRLILASTCKAIVPETVYGASKLVAERMTLNEAGVVARLYNIWPSHGNVLELWAKQIGKHNAVYVTDCWRYAITMNEAVTFLASMVTAARNARYSPFPGDAMHMPDVAQRYIDIHHSDAETPPSIVSIPRRRGDREREPLVGHHETVHIDQYRRMVVTSEHDHPAPAVFENDLTYA